MSDLKVTSAIDGDLIHRCVLLPLISVVVVVVVVGEVCFMLPHVLQKGIRLIDHNNTYESEWYLTTYLVSP